MRIFHLTACAVVSACLSLPLSAQSPSPPPPLQVAPPAVTAATEMPLPAMRFVGTLAGDEIYNLVKAAPRFAKLDREQVGSPIALVVTHNFETSAGGKAGGLLSAVLAGSTLGLIPLVINGDLVVTYEFQVNGVAVTSRSYQKNYTQAQNLLAKDATYGLGKEGLAWARATVDQFLTDTRDDPKLAALVAEYQFYFASPAR